MQIGDLPKEIKDLDMMEFENYLSRVKNGKLYKFEIDLSEDAKDLANKIYENGLYKKLENNLYLASYTTMLTKIIEKVSNGEITKNQAYSFLIEIGDNAENNYIRSWNDYREGMENLFNSLMISIETNSTENGKIPHIPQKDE